MDTLTAEKVRNQVFKLTFFKEGYRIDDVDSLLDKIAESLAAWEAHHPEDVTVTSDALVPSQLPVARFRETYNKESVDAFIEEAREALAFYENYRYR
ncbi:DivIVA domain-containing protein [Bifidobacterium boum]|uniref:DivIVA domain-containing protein n=1 Tax=Bifidobacterium boum TaxID=78343 RepID=A0A848D700_9BIFI|nr:DivIVA domain-containing protein [Bifidobacterium boum]NMF01631.1 DivIVA domain-containing protein [Bifidobacterium boum]